MTKTRKPSRRKRRATIMFSFAFGILGWLGYEYLHSQPEEAPVYVTVEETQNTGERATEVLETLKTKSRAPKTGYERSQFGSGWANWRECDVRNKILARDLKDVVYQEDNCTVASGKLNDPYTGEVIHFTRGSSTSSDVQIDHVVALSDAWQKGAQQLEREQRVALANDDLNLLAVDGNANMQKGAGDTATWLPKNKAFRCQYVARQIAVKAKYSLWVTDAEKQAMSNILDACPDQRVPAS